MRHTVKLQLILFCYALSYFTRIPIPRGIHFDNDQFHKANAYLPIIGAVVALMMMAIFYVCQLIFSLPVSLLLMLIGGLLITGALHEDGFADCCDGLGGGYNKEQRLSIMKDSQIGTYGSLGLIVLFLLKFNLLIELASSSSVTLFGALFIAHIISRYVALCMMHYLPYARIQESGKVQALVPRISALYFLFSSLCCFSVLGLLPLNIALYMSVLVAIVFFALRRLFLKNLTGYTGDCLGFVQQCVELSIFLLLSVFWV